MLSLIRTGLLYTAIVSAIPSFHADKALTSRAACDGNDASDRSVWCDYSIETDYYTDGPETGETKEFWLEVTNTTLAPDGVERVVLAVNGTVPGPTIEANWGDTVVIHVTNSLTANGTGIHWHGVRQNWTVQNDGVPSITQCPIAPGESLTYTWKATQYGSSWYHSHYSLQAWEGVFGPIIIHGPATADYDEELDTVMITDWSHDTADSLYNYAQTNGPVPMDNGLINGMNVYNNSGTIVGERYEATVASGNTYLLRLVNTAIDTYFKFSIDNHTMTVIANDFVPVVPFEIDVLDITMGQRYDILITADQDPGDYWIRAIPQVSCSSALNADNIRAILRYDSSSTADPTTTAWAQTDSCVDVDSSSLVPYLSQSVTSPTGSDLDVNVFFNSESFFRWEIAPNSMQVEWSDPTLMKVYEGNTSFADDTCVYELPDPDVWVYWVIETAIAVPHPIHLHGHDFYILASSGSSTFDSSTVLNLDNPPRRDVATLPAGGFLVIAFKTDNPGTWLMHCHIGWHTSEGLALQFLERESEIAALVDGSKGNATCAAWDSWASSTGIEEEDSGV